MSSSASPVLPTPAHNRQSPELIAVEGVLEILNGKDGLLLSPQFAFKRRPQTPTVPMDLIKRFNLKRGSFIKANAHQDQRWPSPKVCFVQQVDNLTIAERRHHADFTSLTTITPNEQILLETQGGPLSGRILDLFCPIGKGQRGLIVAPPRTGKTTLLKDIAHGILTNHKDCHLMLVLVDERPEEVTDFRRTALGAEVWASSNDEEAENHIQLAELAIERAKRLVEVGKHVVVLLDSLTRLARAHNSAKGNSGRTMTGGMDIRALEKPRQLFSAARNTEEGGSLTIIATALIETGSRMDDLIFQEFKGTGNMEMVLDRKVAELRLWPAINLSSSGTRKEELLLVPEVLTKAHFFRRALANQKTDEAAELLITRMSKVSTNADFLKLINH